MTEFPDRPGYSFDPGPPPEVARFFANKGIAPSFSFQDVEPAEHAVSFVVAKMAQEDMLSAAKGEVQRAIDEGMTFEAFKKSWRGNAALKEWWGREVQTDPVTGQERIVQLGSPRRLRTIYRANLRAARAAGQWERIERTKRAMPYLEYRLGPSERHRPHHVAKEGLVLPVDDPFWDDWMPPNGWGCKCWVRQITRRAAEEKGISRSPGRETREFINPRTGEVKDVPVGLDPSWDRNPGKLRRQHMEQLLEGKLSAASEPEARAALRDMASSWAVQRVLQGRSDAAVPVALMPPEIGAALGNQARFVRITDRTGQTIGAQSGAAVTPEVMARVSDALVEGPLAEETDAEGRRSLAILVDGPDAWEAIVTSLPETDELWISAVRQTSRAEWRERLARETRTLLRE
ncbi:Uncharacterized conserved protein, contains phage Mu gpF-like domain [Roseivivax halotolerans]|uniref:Uncharacterized conserved protein, contains phage Mu gpF-like domain n=1 Tax=Roseivivax halotolerans TaxID=93684 RepID=A0A1I5W3H0_9RHOB|nr:phage minor head protein [Roseivivax halotolerans]SFQ14275.1 Uncharacterized conserved protein, contains phage Mu gpF-like domain [Roseivivax halotolerans]